MITYLNYLIMSHKTELNNIAYSASLQLNPIVPFFSDTYSD